MKATDLEMQELLEVIYPDRFDNDSFEADEFLSNVNDACKCHGIDFELDDFVERLVKLTSPMASRITGEIYQALGKITIEGNNVSMDTIIKRKLES